MILLYFVTSSWESLYLEIISELREGPFFLELDTVEFDPDIKREFYSFEFEPLDPIAGRLTSDLSEGLKFDEILICALGSSSLEGLRPLVPGSFNYPISKIDY